MNRKKQILAIFLVVLMVSVALLTACGVQEITYQVSVTDAMGNPYSKGVAVYFMQGDERAGMQPVDKNGVAEMVLPAGDYTVALNLTDTETSYTYDETELTLSADKTQLSVIVNRSLGEKTQTLLAGDKECTAHFVDAGCTEFPLNADKMTYLLFEPTQAGKYEFSLIGSDSVIGYYGTPHFVLSESAVPADDTVSVSVSQEEIDSGTTQLVLGVPAGEGTAILGIFRVGDAEQIAEMPWNTDWQAGHQKTDGCRVEPTEELKYFDITAKSGKYDLFYDKETGYYRLKKNGPVVLVALGKNNNPKYSGAGLYERVNGNGMYGGADVVRYFYGENGELEKREKYTDMLLEMFEHSGIAAYDQDVYHPLTKDLAYVLQNGFASWWDPESPDFQETFAKANPEYAWLFACCYEK